LEKVYKNSSFKNELNIFEKLPSGCRLLLSKFFIRQLYETKSISIKIVLLWKKYTNIALHHKRLTASRVACCRLYLLSARELIERYLEKEPNP
jgi:hypothetical protein